MRATGLVSILLAAWLAFPPGALAGFRTVVVDAGHGGHDRGGIPGQKVAEKTVALDVAKRLQRRLQAAGLSVVMTRTGDYFVPLGTRVAAANNRKGSVLVSVHFNAAARVGARGIETYYYSARSADLAQSVHRRVVAAARTEDRGIRRRGFYVLRRTRGPSVLVECGFLTNPQEARKALDAGHREALAKAIAEGVIARSRQ